MNKNKKIKKLTKKLNSCKVVLRMLKDMYRECQVREANMKHIHRFDCCEYLD